MKINGIELKKYCRHCEAIVDCSVKICPFCGKDNTYPILEKYLGLTFEQIKSLINQAFFSLESFMNGRLREYKYFGFNDAFTKLFFEAHKHENFRYDNCQLIGKYLDLTDRIGVDYDHDDYENIEAHKNSLFCKDCEEIKYLNFYRNCEFVAFLSPEEIAENERKFSIADIIELPTSSLQPAEPREEPEPPTFTNNFDNISPNDIFKHFSAGLVTKRYLTEQELNEYLKAAFELKTKPDTLFKIKDAPSKPTIEAVFYNYYKNVAGKPHNKQKQYAALLGEYFEGYKTSTVSTNFSKSVVYFHKSVN